MQDAESEIEYVHSWWRRHLQILISNNSNRNNNGDDDDYDNDN